MFTSIKIKKWLDWRLLGAHLCTLVITLSFNSTWRVPREAARFGGVQYALALTVALLVVALPLTLLQLAVGQLSQQDAVGLWRAVPIFKGVGYLRLLVSFLGSIYAVIYLALTVALFLYTLKNSIPFMECTNLSLTEDGYLNLFNATNCLDVTFMAPVESNPEYFIALSLIIIFTWISLPFVLYNPVKWLKRAFYILGPLVIILSIASVSGMAGSGRLPWMLKSEDWSNFEDPHIWFGAITQALLTSEVAGGYLVSAGDSIYANNDVRWTSIVLIVTSIAVNWVGLTFWYSIGGDPEMDTSAASVLVQIYAVAVEDDIDIVWPLLAFAALFCSGIITMLTRLYPIYDRIRRMGGVRWRAVCAVSALLSAAASVAVLSGHWIALAVLEAYAVPLLVCTATVLEVLALVGIYGGKALMADVEFLTGDPLSKGWVWTWCAAPIIVAPFTVWWAVTVGSESWQDPPWPPAVVAATSAVTVAVLVACAAVAVVRQVQYDIIGKLKSSLKPSRHWGPRDPITHYYWLARREEAQRENPSESRYRRRHLGQLTGSFISKPINLIKDHETDSSKKRSNSDDWIYTIYRKKHLQEIISGYLAQTKNRSKSLDTPKGPSSKGIQTEPVQIKVKNISVYETPFDSVESLKDDKRTVYSDNFKSSRC